MTTEGSAEEDVMEAAYIAWRDSQPKADTPWQRAAFMAGVASTAAERTRLEARLAEASARASDTYLGLVSAQDDVAYERGRAEQAEERLTALRAAVRPLVEAAEWYADPQVYCHDDSECSPACHDEGFKARNALADPAIAALLDQQKDGVD